jgi:hypothetical protein
LFFTACGDDAKKPEVKISISPTAKTVTAGESVSLTVTVSNTEVVWPTTVQGTLVKTGNTAVYTPPPKADKYTIVVTAKADPKVAATATITVVLPPEPTVAITAKPSDGKIADFTEFQFGAEASDGKTVKWSVEGGIGKISQEGLFTADGHPGDGKVIATIVGNSGQEISDEVEITVERGAELREVLSVDITSLNPSTMFSVWPGGEVWCDGSLFATVCHRISDGAVVPTEPQKWQTQDGVEYYFTVWGKTSADIVRIWAASSPNAWFDDPHLFDHTVPAGGNYSGQGFNPEKGIGSFLTDVGILIIKNFDDIEWQVNIAGSLFPLAVYPVTDEVFIVAYYDGVEKTGMMDLPDFSYETTYLDTEGKTLLARLHRGNSFVDNDHDNYDDNYKELWVDGRVTAITQTEDGKYRISVIRENPDGAVVGLVLETAYPDSL